MVHIPRPQSELALSRRVRVEPIKISEIKIDLAQLLSGAPRRKRRELHAHLNNTKGPDREDRVRLISNAVLVLIPDKPDGGYTTFLIGTGVGSREPLFTAEVAADDTSGRLDAGLKKPGVKPDEVDHVILPCLDSYHSSNLIRQDNRGNREPICRNAEYIVHRDEYDAVMSAPKSTARVYHNIKSDLMVLQDKLRDSGDEIRIFDGDELKIGEFVRIVRHGGATNGYCSVYVKVYSETIVISSLFFPTVCHLDPGIQLADSFSRVETYEAKEQLLNECWENQYMVYFPFDPGLTAGYVQPTSGGWTLEKVGDILH